MKRTALIYALVLLLALTAIMAMAQGKRANTSPNQPAGCFATCQKALGLSQAQIDEMTAIGTAFANDTAALRTSLQAKAKEMADLWAVADPDLQLIKQKAAEADQIRAEIRDKAIDTRGAILRVLTPAQRAKCIQRCLSGECGCGMCAGLGMGMGMGMCGAGGAGTCPMGTGAGRGGAGMGPGAGRGACGSGTAGGCCPMKR